MLEVIKGLELIVNIQVLFLGGQKFVVTHCIYFVLNYSFDGIVFVLSVFKFLVS